MLVGETQLESLPSSDGKSWRAGNGAGTIELLRSNTVNLVTWSRKLPRGTGVALTRWTHQFPATFDEHVTVRALDLTSAMHGVEQPFRAWLCADIERLVTRLAAFSNSDRLRVFFGAVRGDQCRKFHVDYLRYRLITTYVGPGTEWLPEEAVQRAALEPSLEHAHHANEKIVKNPAAVRRALAGDVLVMKGERARPGAALVHRSPPIQGTGKARVVLIANTID